MIWKKETTVKKKQKINIPTFTIIISKT